MRFLSYAAFILDAEGRRVCEKQWLRAGAASKHELPPAGMLGPSAFACGPRSRSARSLTDKGLKCLAESLSSLSPSPLLARRAAEKCSNAASIMWGITFHTCLMVAHVFLLRCYHLA